MISQGKCPKCEKIVHNVIIDGVTAKEFLSTEGWKGITYLCPHCKTILGVQIDPIAIKTDTVNAVVDLLMQKLRR
jgi:hypothetical protein